MSSEPDETQLTAEQEVVLGKLASRTGSGMGFEELLAELGWALSTLREVLLPLEERKYVSYDADTDSLRISMLGRTAYYNRNI